MQIATITAIHVEQRFGVLDIDQRTQDITAFREKVQTDGACINGGYMVFSPQIFDYLEGDQTILEQEPLKRLAEDGQLKAYDHNGFWKCMDTKREMEQLEEMIEQKRAPWMVWEK